MGAKPQYVTIHPGEVLRIELDEKGISQKEFAATLSMPAPVLNDILNGKRNITPDIAVLLESILNHEASYWLKLQAERDIEVAKMKEEFIQKQRDIETLKNSSTDFILSRTVFPSPPAICFSKNLVLQQS